MPRWLWPLLIVTAAGLLVVIVGKILRPMNESVIATYPGGVQFGGSVRGGRVTFDIVQWVSDPVDPLPCPLVIHLPKGDLGGSSLCDWGAPVAAERLGSPEKLDVFPFHRGGKVVGVRVGAIPGCPSVEMSVAGKRFSLPLPEQDAVRQLGAPTSRTILDSQMNPHPDNR